MNNHKPYGLYEKLFKRPIDILCSFLALLVLSPVFLVSAVLVRIKLGSPILFSQERPGKNERIFKLYKFRTMKNAYNEKGEFLPDTERLTSFGRKLRSTSIDELPELVNILRGDMSIVGPTPLSIKYIPYYTEEEHHRHDVRPGLTGLAQVEGRNAISWEEKFRKDIQYVNRITFFSDVVIVLKTVKSVFIRENIGQGDQAPISLHLLRQEATKNDN